MPLSTRSEVTRILHELCDGEAAAPEVTTRLLELVYDELRRLAASYIRRERVGHTLQPTALVHEAYLKLVDDTGIQWQDRAHFLGIAARAMRQVLIDNARRHAAAKRGGDWQRVTLDENIHLAENREFELLALDDAMQKLTELDERAARVAELRLFGGLSVRETATVLGVSARTVDNDWAVARMWLSRELRDDE